MSDAQIASLAGLTPDAVTLLQRHNLLLPLAKSLIEEQVVTDTVLIHEEREQVLAKWAGQLGLEQALEQAQQRLGLTTADVTWQVERPLRLARRAQEMFAGKAEARFLQRKGDLDLVTYSLVRVKEGCLAKELYLRLSAGEASFAEIAQRYSKGPERQAQGVIGPKPISQAHPLLAERLRTARDGEVIDPFPAADWWLVVRRESFQPAVLDEAMSQRMAEELLQEWIDEEALRSLQHFPIGFEVRQAPKG